jgi:hypothetical protein
MFPESVLLLSFIQAGGVHGLAHKWMSGLTAIAALMNGINSFLSWAIEKLAIV